MKKSDLKTGMWVELRNGNKYIYLEGCETKRHGVQHIFVNTDEEGFTLAEDYNTDLKNSCYEVFDIVKIYWDKKLKVNALTLNECPPLYWERQEKTYLEDFLEKFPNAVLREGLPEGICLEKLYSQRHYNCSGHICRRGGEEPCCWDQPLGESWRGEK